jgi:hypothetical protein
VPVALPFSVDQFLSVFAAYNQSFWPVALVLWVASAALLIAAWRQPARWNRALSLLLAAQWLWSGVAYHALLFTRINPAAWMFAALFVAQGWLFVRYRALRYFSTSGARNAIGLGLSVYALAYPILSMTIHAYPATPTYGVPCPTAIMTIGILITAGRVPALAVIPVLWGLIGGSAAILLTVPLDYALLASGVFMLIVTLTRK